MGFALRTPGTSVRHRFLAAASAFALILIGLLAGVGCGNGSPSAPSTPPANIPGPALPSPLLKLHGTVFMDPDVILPSDVSVLKTLSYAGTAERLMFDRRLDAFQTLRAFLFSAVSDDGQTVEIQVNPEFGSVEAASGEAQKYARLLGQLPAVLRADVKTMWIHQGVAPFGGGNNNVMIHTGQAALYDDGGVLEEAIVHEATHTSIDSPHQSSPAWLDAQRGDADFISTHARDFAAREDLAESFLPWMALRYRRARISDQLAETIEKRMPRRLTYFDQQSFHMTPVR